MPENEWPTNTVGPCCMASARCADATASGSVVSGFCTEVTLRPFGCSRAMTSDQDDPSANRPCTRTMFWALAAGCACARRCRRGLAAAAMAMLTKERRSIGFLLPHPLSSLERGGGSGAVRLATPANTPNPAETFPIRRCRSQGRFGAAGGDQRPDESAARTSFLLRRRRRQNLLDVRDHRLLLR